MQNIYCSHYCWFFYNRPICATAQYLLCSDIWLLLFVFLSQSVCTLPHYAVNRKARPTLTTSAPMTSLFMKSKLSLFVYMFSHVSVQSFTGALVWSWDERSQSWILVLSPFFMHLTVPFVLKHKYSWNQISNFHYFQQPEQNFWCSSVSPVSMQTLVLWTWPCCTDTAANSTRSWRWVSPAASPWAGMSRMQQDTFSLTQLYSRCLVLSSRGACWCATGWTVLILYWSDWSVLVRLHWSNWSSNIIILISAPSTWSILSLHFVLLVASSYKTFGLVCFDVCCHGDNIPPQDCCHLSQWQQCSHPVFTLTHAHQSLSRWTSPRRDAWFMPLTLFIS